jgi:hypothetical protein
MRTKTAAGTVAVMATVLATSLTAAPAGAAPKPAGPAGPAEFIGKPAVAKPLKGIPATPQNPYMAGNGKSSTHNDSWQTDAYTGKGPLGKNPVKRSTDFVGDCISTTFDRKGDMVAICVDPSVGPTLYKFDPKTLDQKAKYDLPPRQTPPPGISPLKDTGGGAYFYMDNKDRIWNGTTTRHIQVIREKGDGFALDRDYDLTNVLRDDERINSVLPDWSGKIWYVARRSGVVGVLDPKTGKTNVVRLGKGLDGEIENSFAVGEDGAYIATNREMVKFRIGPGMKPQIVWRDAYKTIKGLTKPGQFDDGTGTTPTLMPGGYVAITDNADPMNVVVYRTADKLAKGQKRKVCEVPVFSKGKSATENSLVNVGKSLIVENNYGYDVLEFGSDPTKVSEPGLARVDVNAAGTGCKVVWRSNERAPNVIPKASLATGLLYTFTNEPSAGADDPWYWTALDFRTGKTVFKSLAGNGSAWNNHYAGINLGPDGTAYLSGYPGGWWSLSDGR